MVGHFYYIKGQNLFIFAKFPQKLPLRVFL
jgi:hypothetical protein